MTVANDDGGSASASDANAGRDDDAVAQLVSSLRLTEDEEEDLLSLDYDDTCLREEGEVMETLPLCGVDNETGSVSAPPQTYGNEDGDRTQNAVNPNEVIILDLQMVFHRGRGSLIKELAYRVWNTGYVYGLSLKHNVTDVPAHLVFRTANRCRDVFTGLDLESGEYDYDDSVVANALNGYRVALVKGANKKSALVKLYGRLNAAAVPGGVVYQQPFVVNIDGQTADEEDRRFCNANGMTLATFSFPFVYANMRAYMELLHRETAHMPTAALYTNNVMAKDPRYNVLGQGRVVCVCHSDHSCGGVDKYFSKKHRCSLLNISILELLWFKGQDAEFRKLVKATRGENSGQRRKQQQQRTPTRPHGGQLRAGRQPEERRSLYTDQYAQGGRSDAYRYEHEDKENNRNIDNFQHRNSDHHMGWYEESERQYAGDYYQPYGENQRDGYGANGAWETGEYRDVEQRCYDRSQNNRGFQPETFDERRGTTEMEYNRYGGSRMRDLGINRSADGDGNYKGIGSATETDQFNNNGYGYGQDQQALVLVIRDGRKRRRARRDNRLAERVYGKQRGKNNGTQ